jgi:hypothetical protein
MPFSSSEVFLVLCGPDRITGTLSLSDLPASHLARWHKRLVMSSLIEKR